MTTITHDAWEAARKKAGIAPEVADEFLHALGITIAPPEPPEGMVKLAREIAEQAMKGRFYSANASGYRCAGAEAALAALQHADKVVREAERPYGCVDVQHAVSEYKRVLRRKLGAIA